MKTIANTFFKGLLFTLPVVITFGFLYWVFATAEALFEIPFKWILPDGWYMTGMGVASAIALIFIFGVLVQAYLIKYLFQWFELLVNKIPVVSTLYGSARDLLHFVAGDKSQGMQKVVMVTFDQDVRIMGFVTKEDVVINDEEGLVAVYLPMSYQISGFVVYVPKSRCETMDIPVQQAMQQILTANMVSQKTNNK